MLLATIVFAEEQYGIPLNKSISPGRTAVKYEETIFQFNTQGNFQATFQRLDDQHVRVFVKPVEEENQPYSDIVLQWGSFPPVILSVGSPGGEGFTLNTETGYAEK
jgi:hypothetical protein